MRTGRVICMFKHNEAGSGRLLTNVRPLESRKRLITGQHTGIKHPDLFPLPLNKV